MCKNCSYPVGLASEEKIIVILDQNKPQFENNNSKKLFPLMIEFEHDIMEYEVRTIIN